VQLLNTLKLTLLVELTDHLDLDGVRVQAQGESSRITLSVKQSNVDRLSLELLVALPRTSASL
jgi:hypothetical protein